MALHLNSDATGGRLLCLRRRLGWLCGSPRSLKQAVHRGQLLLESCAYVVVSVVALSIFDDPCRLSHDVEELGPGEDDLVVTEKAQTGLERLDPFLGTFCCCKHNKKTS